MTVHLVNLTNPMMMKGPFRELIPVGEQRVVVRLPDGAVAGKVHLLVAGRDLPVEQDGTTAERRGAVGPRSRGRGDRSLRPGGSRRASGNYLLT